MNDSTWKHFQQMTDMARQVLGNDFFQDMQHVSGQQPGYDIYRGASELIVLINIPNVSNIDDLKLTVQEKAVHLQGKVSLGYDHLQAVYQSIFSGDIDMVIDLPEAVYTKRVNARYQRGMLIIQLFPKRKKGTKPITIRD